MSESSFQIRLAEKTIRIRPQGRNLERFCREYLVNTPASEEDFTMTITREDLLREQELARHSLSRPEKRWSEDYLETLALCRKVSLALLECDTILFHASCIAVDGRGICFAAQSGVGKSTHTRLWREQFAGRVTVINDDKPFLKISNAGVTAFGSPWNGIHQLGINGSTPLSAVCLLYRDGTNHIEPVSAEEAYPVLLEQTYRPKERQALERLLPLVDQLSQKVELYSLGCNTEPEAARIAAEALL